MTKRPLLIKNKHKRYCKFCKNEEEIIEIFHIEDKHPVYICKNCIVNYCEICKELKEFITVRKDFNDQDSKNDYQICSDCYMKLCNEIIELDKNYDIIKKDT
jgi:hypothetical protein